MRQALAAGAVVLMLLGAAGAAAQPPVAGPAPYVLGNGASFRVSANSRWGAVRQWLPDLRNPDPSAAIWARTCPRAAQTATFSRTITIPGPPGNATFTLNQLWGSRAASAGANPNPVEWAELKVNGRVLVHRRMTTSFFTAPLDARTVRSAFRFGENEIDVRVHRRALSATTARCNAGGKDFLHDPTHFGVQFALYGDFAADLRFDPKPTAEYKKVTTAVAQFNAVGTITYANAGPSGVVDAKLSLSTTAQLLAVRNAGECKGGPNVTGGGPPGPLGDTFVNPNGPVSIRCDLRNVPPGAHQTISLSLGANAAVTAAFTESRIGVHWELFGGGPADPDITNNQGSEDLVFCGTLSTLEGCKTAP